MKRALEEASKFFAWRARRVVALLSLATVASSSGCASSGRVDGEQRGQQVVGQAVAAVAADVRANIALLKQDVGEQINALKVDQSVNNWDEWSLRLMIFGLVVTPALGYVLPKLAWKRIARWRSARCER